MREPALSIVIVAWNVRDLLLDCIRSIIENTALEYEIIVVDNASSDGTGRALGELADRVAFVPLERNRGFAADANLGIRRSRGDFILLLNPDTLVCGDCLETLVRVLESGDTAGIAGPMQVDRKGRMQCSARRFPSWTTALFGSSSLLCRIAPENRFSRRERPCFSHKTREPLQVDWVTGACLMMKRETLDATGELDERFFMYWEDADWCLRAHRAGWKTYWAPSATIRHAGGASSRQAPLRSAIHYYRSMYLYYCKNIGSSTHASVRLCVLIAIGACCGTALIANAFRHMASRSAKRNSGAAW